MGSLIHSSIHARHEFAFKFQEGEDPSHQLIPGKFPLCPLHSFDLCAAHSLPLSLLLSLSADPSHPAAQPIPSLAPANLSHVCSSHLAFAVLSPSAPSPPPSISSALLSRQPQPMATLPAPPKPPSLSRLLLLLPMLSTGHRQTPLCGVEHRLPP
jgi:hypothetical protein